MKRRFLTGDVSLEDAIVQVTLKRDRILGLESNDLTSVDDDGVEEEDFGITNILEDDITYNSITLSQETQRYLTDAKLLDYALRAAENHLWASEGGGAIAAMRMRRKPHGTDSNVGDSHSNHSNNMEDEEDLLKLPLGTDENEPVEGEKISTEAESDTAVNNDSAWSKFWKFVKRIFENIRIAVVSFFKRVYIWIAGDMAKFTKWYNEYEPKYGKEIRESEVTLKIKPIKLKFEEFNSTTRKDFDEVIKTAEDGAKVLEAGMTSQVVSTSITTGRFFKKVTVTSNSIDYKEIGIAYKEEADKVSLKTLSEKLYGDNRVREVKASEFFKLFPLDMLAKGNEVKNILKTSEDTIRTASRGIKSSVKATKVENKENRKLIKTVASNLQVGLNTISTGLVWSTSAHITLMNVCLRYGKKAVKKIQGEKK